MFNAIIRLSIRYRYLVITACFILACVGITTYKRLIIDAVPDITNVQVQINSSAPGYTPYEVEQRVTQPLELLLAGLPALESIRSLSRYGLSQLTVVFRDGTDIYFARSLISQRLQESRDRLPDGVSPQMGPITTGLGEILMYTVENAPDAQREKSLQELREIQDWVVKPQLRTIPGVVEVNSIGGASKQIVVTPNLEKLRAFQLTLNDIATAVASNNANVGAGFVEQSGEQFLIRAPAQVAAYSDMADIIVGIHEGTPVLIRDVADVGVGSELRAGAATDGGREVVLGNVMMLMGENGRDVSMRVTERLQEISKSLPPGVAVTMKYNRTTLVEATIATVRRNLFEGALLVIAILFAALGNMRAALITALVIPLSMLLTILGMVKWRMSANLMSLGALDFGLIVDGAVILVENSISRLGQAQDKLGRVLTQEERLEVVYDASREVRQATMFGELIIMVVYVPILTLSGIEGKMYHPMALTVLLALFASFVLSLTFVPAAVATFVTGRVRAHGALFERLQIEYGRLLLSLFSYRRAVISGACLIFLLSAVAFTRLGSEFIPSLDEGDVALHALRIPGTSLSQSISMQHQLEKVIKTIPEVSDVFAKIGTAEVATDPMPPSVADGYVILKPRDAWADPSKPKRDVVREIEERVATVPGNNYEFTQPIQMRFNELIAGVRSDVAVKVFGDDPEVLRQEGESIKRILDSIPGAADTKVEQITGLPTVTVQPNRARLSRIGINASEVQEVVRIAYAGAEISTFFEGDRRFPIVLRLGDVDRQNVRAIADLPVSVPSEVAVHRDSIDSRSTRIDLEAPDKAYVTLGDVADISVREGPNQITRENGKRRVVVTANVRNRDLGSFVEEAQRRISQELKLPPQYWLGWGGQYEHLISAEEKLAIVVPLVLLSVFALIYLTFQSFGYSLLVFTGVPFALSGGIFALWLRDIPFSISAAVGFIALSGVSVLNGLVLVTVTKHLLDDGADVVDAILRGATARLRPVLMTALVASLGFVPMAISQGTGSEVQRPLATVVIGGIFSATVLTLVVVPVLLYVFGGQKINLGHRFMNAARSWSARARVSTIIALIACLTWVGCASTTSSAQRALFIDIQKEVPLGVQLEVQVSEQGESVLVHGHLTENRPTRGVFGQVRCEVVDASGKLVSSQVLTLRTARHGTGRSLSYSEFSFPLPRAVATHATLVFRYESRHPDAAASAPTSNGTKAD